MNICLFLLLFPIVWEVGHRGSCCDFQEKFNKGVFERLEESSLNMNADLLFIGLLLTKSPYKQSTDSALAT